MGYIFLFTPESCILDKFAAPAHFVKITYLRNVVCMPWSSNENARVVTGHMFSWRREGLVSNHLYVTVLMQLGPLIVINLFECSNPSSYYAPSEPCYGRAM